jgi:iron(III) transport system substrate-binding protein
MSFEQDFPDIKVEYIGANSRDFWPRIFRERELGQYLWDLRVGGPDPQVYEAKDKGVLDPVRPVLRLPEVTDDSRWYGGLDGLFFDRQEKYVAGFVNFVSFLAYVNRDVIPETELQSVKDLTNPRWKGKIVIQDPRGGAGLNSLEVLLKIQGEQIVKDLLSKQDLVVTNDLRQQAEWVIRGRYPIAIGLVPDAFLVFQEQGLSLNIRPIPDSGNALSTGTGGIQLLNRAAHPNAAAVYINWLLTKDVQARLSAATKQNSRRLDVPPADPSAVPDPKRRAELIPTQLEELLPYRLRAQQLAQALLK